MNPLIEQALDLLDDADTIYRICLAEGYAPYGEHEEQIQELCQQAESLAQGCGLDVDYMSHCGSDDGIADLREQIEEGVEE